MIFKKKSLLLLGILILSIVAIDTFVFPKIEENCSCGMGDELHPILCQEYCPNGDCSISLYYGRCVGTSCRTVNKMSCLTIFDVTVTYHIWEEPCWQCLEW